MQFRSASQTAWGKKGLKRQTRIIYGINSARVNNALCKLCKIKNKDSLVKPFQQRDGKEQMRVTEQKEKGGEKKETQRRQQKWRAINGVMLKGPLVSYGRCKHQCFCKMHHSDKEKQTQN